MIHLARMQTLPYETSLASMSIFNITFSLVDLNRIGRRKMVSASFLGGAVGAVGALLLSDLAENDKGTESFKGIVFVCL